MTTNPPTSTRSETKPPTANGREPLFLFLATLTILALVAFIFGNVFSLVMTSLRDTADAKEYAEVFVDAYDAERSNADGRSPEELAMAAGRKVVGAGATVAVIQFLPDERGVIEVQDAGGQSRACFGLPDQPGEPLDYTRCVLYTDR
jgi:hypothetical protein